MYSLHEGWRARSTSPALIYGTAIHKALEVFYSHPKSERTIPIDFDEVAPKILEGYEPIEPHFLYDSIKAFIVAGDDLRNLPYGDQRSLASGIWVLGHYFRTYLHDTHVIYADDKGPCVERTVEHLLHEDSELRIIVFGTIDLVLKNEATGEVLPCDHKTSSRMGHEFFNRVKPNSQYTGYIWLAVKELGLDGQNFMVNGIQVKALPKRNAGPPTFSRQITRRTEQDFQEFSDVILSAVRNYLSWSESKVWPLGPVDSCASYGGCSFLEVCSAPNELRENILSAKFERV